LNKRPPCWGIGLGRTGTESFCEALRILGYGAVGHNPEFSQLRSLDGGADNGVTVFYKYLDFKFPGSKFVLMLREQNSWLDSMEYIFAVYPVKSRDEDIPIQRRMALYETTSFDRNMIRDSYYRHCDDVHRYFRNRPGDLLEMNIIDGDGWNKLCPFLGLSVPDEPFPHKNCRVLSDGQ
jgi:Sulfotransferase domain